MFPRLEKSNAECYEYWVTRKSGEGKNINILLVEETGIDEELFDRYSLQAEGVDQCKEVEKSEF